MLEGVLKGVQIVELHDAGGFGRIDWRSDIAAPRANHAVLDRGERFVDGAVVAIIKHQDFRPLRDFARDTNRKAVGVGGGERELPVRKAEAALEIFANPDGVLGGKHEGDAFFGAPGDGFGNDLGRVAGHCAGVAEAKIDIVAAIEVGEVGALGGFYKNGESARPFFHPVHGHAPEERGLGAMVESCGLGMDG
jgi:hypothetical protein